MEKSSEHNPVIVLWAHNFWVCINRKCY